MLPVTTKLAGLAPLTYWGGGSVSPIDWILCGDLNLCEDINRHDMKRYQPSTGDERLAKVLDVGGFDEATWNSLLETGYERSLEVDDNSDLANGIRWNRRTGPTLANEWLSTPEQDARQLRRAARARVARLRLAENRRHNRRVSFEPQLEPFSETLLGNDTII